MELDLDICERILHKLYEHWATPQGDTLMDELLEISGTDENFIAHVSAMQGRGLIWPFIRDGAEGAYYVGLPQITRRGLEATYRPILEEAMK